MIVDLQSLCKKSKVTTIAILFHISRFGIIAAYSYFNKNKTSLKILMIGLSNFFSLSICDLLRNS